MGSIVGPLDPATFRATTGLLEANWCQTNYSGIGPTFPMGTNNPIPANVFAWADPMPDQESRFFQPGPGLSNAYELFLNSIDAGADATTVAQAKLNFAKTAYQMADGTGLSWPSYSITPGLNDFELTSLQTITSRMPPQIDFTLNGPVGSGSAAPAVRPALMRTVSFEEMPALGPLAGSMPFFGVDGRAVPELPTVAPPRGAMLRMAAAMPAAPKKWTIRFQVQALQMFTVQPSMWFSANMVKLFAGKINPNSALANQPVLGPDGFLNGRISQIMVAFHRTVTVTSSDGDASDFQQAAQKAQKFNVGAFHFTNNANATSIGTSPAGDVIFQDNKNMPVVIGVVMKPF